MQFAKLKWVNQQPYSLEFHDVYYSADNGLAETEYVFIQQNHLAERFSNLQSAEFTIIETGFGTGLNFFATVQHWLKHAPAHAKLTFISIERYPLNLQDFIKANQPWPYHALVDQLASDYAQLNDGLNQLSCCDNRIELALWIGDVSAMLPKIQTKADAWFLDGFAPSKNDDMWSDSLFQEIAHLSKPNTSFATFTCAGRVRRNLQNAGFAVAKVPGFGKKREMLSGSFKTS